jgi:hypothetical protein
MSQVVCGGCCRSGSPAVTFPFPSLIAAPSGGLSHATVQPKPPTATGKTAFTGIGFFQGVNLPIFPVGSGHGPLRKRLWAKARPGGCVGRSRKAAMVAVSKAKEKSHV